MQPDSAPRSTMTATYSPEDNKLRLYSGSRLDADTFARVKAAGFRWAPKQELFVAPMWTPERAALLVELCGEIDDEDKSLVDRAEERADRFEEYGEHRAEDAHRARAAVAAIADNIPLGQPILVGHHSEKHARRDAKRIENGMRKAVQMWETSKYWEARAKSAVRHAKYKEVPAVRHRRIKGLESDKRKQEKEIKISESFAALWAKAETVEQAAKIANYDHVYAPPDPAKAHRESLWSALDGGRITAADAAKIALACHAGGVERARQWLQHIDNRLAYERAMLDEGGGLAADKFPIEVGGRVLANDWRARSWVVVLRVNRANGRINSVSTKEGTISVEDVTEYRAPESGDAEKVKAATKLAPLANYPGEGFRHMLKADYDKRAKHSDFYAVRRMKATATHGAHRRREAPKEGGQYYDTVGVYITDAKRVDPPAPAPAPDASPLAPIAAAPRLARVSEPKERTEFDDMRDSLKAGVSVVSAPQLFPTPATLIHRIMEVAEVTEDHRVLEPSAGTGAILRELRSTGAETVAVEVSARLTISLQPLGTIVCADFLTLSADALGGVFDRVVMNPPFADGADVEHVTHAFRMLKAGGRLVAIMSAGVEFKTDKRTEAFRALVAKNGGTIERLPADSFRSVGTSVNTVLVTMEAP